MGLLRVLPIVILALQLYEARGENLPELPENKLLVEPAKSFPEGQYRKLYTECSEKGQTPPQYVLTNSGTYKPNEVLTKAIFERTPFTSAVVPNEFMERVETIGNRKTKVGGEGILSFTKVQYKSLFREFGLGTTLTEYALHVNSSGEYAYWLPQGGYVDIPRTPATTDPKYVFTPDFSGCSWTVTPLNNGMLRLRHVTGDRENPEFNNLPLTEKGGTVTYAKQYKDYGYIMLNNQRYENGLAYTYMHYSNGAWSMYTQQKTCAPFTGRAIFKNEKLVSITVSYSKKKHYDMISGTKVFRIP